MGAAKMPRRTILSAAVIGAAGAVVAGCSPAPQPGGTPSPQLRPVPPECVQLGDFEFGGSQYFCQATVDQLDPVADPDRRPVFYTPPMLVTATHLVARYTNAVVEWEIATGAVSRLLAPRRSDNPLFAHRGDLTVVPRCDGALIVHREGCVIAELYGHNPRRKGLPADGILGLQMVDDQHLISLGADDTLRRWAVERSEQVAVIDLPAATSDRQLAFDQATNRVVTSDESTAWVYDAGTLELIAEVGDLPAARSNWRGLPNGDLVSAAKRDDQRGINIWHQASGEVEYWATKWDIGDFAVAADGTILVIDDAVLKRRLPDGRVEHLPIDKEARGDLACTPDGALLHTMDSIDGIKTFDVATGALLASCQKPE